MKTPQAPPASLLQRFTHQPFLLLTLAAMFWAGNLIVGRMVAGHVPPVALSCARWAGAFVVLLPFAWPHFRKDWPTIRNCLPLMLILAATGISANNVLTFSGLQYTLALNALLVQSSGPLFIALWALVLFRIPLTLRQILGLGTSLIGVLVIILRGDLTALGAIQFNKGDLLVMGGLVVFGCYSALMTRRPAMHPLSFMAFATGCGTLLLSPFVVLETMAGFSMVFDRLTVGAVLYTMIFPSALAYLFFNRAIELVGPNRSAPFLHLTPVFGSVMAIGLLGERPALFHLVGYVLVVTGVFVATRR